MIIVSKFFSICLQAAAITADYKFNVYGREMPSNEEEVKQIWSSVRRIRFKLTYYL